MKSGVIPIFFAFQFFIFCRYIFCYEISIVFSDRTSPRFEGMGELFIGVDDPEGDFRVNPAKATLLEAGLFYAYPGILVLEHNNKSFSNGDFSSEMKISTLGATPDAGFLKMYPSGFFYGITLPYRFDYDYFKFTYTFSTGYGDTQNGYTHAERRLRVSHFIPANLIIGGKTGRVSLGIQVSPVYNIESDKRFSTESYQKEQIIESKYDNRRLDISVKPGILLYLDDDFRLSAFVDMIALSDGKRSLKDYKENGVSKPMREEYDVEMKRLNGEIEVLKEFEKSTVGFLVGLFDERTKEKALDFSQESKLRKGMRFGMGISYTPINSTLIGSDLLYASIETDNPIFIMPFIGEIDYSENIKSNNIQWKTGIEQKVTDKFTIRAGSIMTWNVYDTTSVYSDEYYTSTSRSSGNKFNTTSITGGFSYEFNRIRFDYLLRFDNIASFVSMEVTNVFGFVKGF